MLDENIPKESQPHCPNFMTSGMIRASVEMAGTMLRRVSSTGYGERLDYDTGPLNKGDIAILRLLAAVELIESDLWQQYEELGGVTQGSQNNYQVALQLLDRHSSQSITSNTLDEISHAAFLNAFLESKGAAPVEFDRFRTLRGSIATGAQDTGRLTNLMHLDMDTSWYLRYRCVERPDLKHSFPEAIRVVKQAGHSSLR